MIAPRLTTACLLALALATASGCGTGGGIRAGEHVTVYLSAPLHGPQAARGRRAVSRARAVLADAGRRVGGLRVEAVYMDDTANGRWSAVRVAANARRATEDSTAVAYLGELQPRATRISRAITDQAGLLQIAPPGRLAMRQAIDAIRAAGDAGDDRASVRDAWSPNG